ncbi:hypothetical protein [Amycolatopsis sp. NPDC004079]|uniref:hypothetical protein n=1 Tax=Amycolatopsis sp. NPDC004079 TaxID=3154549 RepID=UPI0033B6BC75
MRLVRLGQQPSRVAEDVRAALASLGRGSTVIGGVALVGARPTGDRPVEAVVVLPAGVLVVIGVDLPDPALRLEAPLSGPWKADGWPLVHGDDVNPATEALDLSQECERRVAELGGGPVGTIVAVGPYVETVDQPPGDLAGPVRVLHPTPTTMLAATVSLATARHPRSVDQARALISALAPDAPELSDEVLRGEGFVRFADDVPVPPGPRSPGVGGPAGAGAGGAGAPNVSSSGATATNSVASPSTSPAPAGAGAQAGSSTANGASGGTAVAGLGAVAAGAAMSGAAGTIAEPDAAGSGVPSTPGSANAASSGGAQTRTVQPAADSAAGVGATRGDAAGPGGAGAIAPDATPPGTTESGAAGSRTAGTTVAGSDATAGKSAAASAPATSPEPQGPAGAGNPQGLPVFPGAASGSADSVPSKGTASPGTPSAAPKSAASPVLRPKIIAVRPPRPEIPSIELAALSEAPTESTDPPEAPTEKMPSPAKPQGAGRPRGAVPPVVPGSPPQGAPQPVRPAPAVGAAGTTSPAIGAAAASGVGAGVPTATGPAAAAGPNTPSGPGKPGSRTVKWVPIAAIVLLIVLVVSAIVVATSGGEDTAAAPPASSAPPSSVPSPAPSSAKPSAPPAPTLTFEPRANSADQKCASHAFGDVQASLQQTSCSGVRRASYTALVDGRPAAVTVAVVEFPDAGQANHLKQIADNPGGGGILDVATETGKWPSGAPQFDGAAYASKVDGNGVRIVQAVWQPGPSTADDPGLARAAKGALDLQLPS